MVSPSTTAAVDREMPPSPHAAISNASAGIRAISFFMRPRLTASARLLCGVDFRLPKTADNDRPFRLRPLLLVWGAERQGSRFCAEGTSDDAFTCRLKPPESAA